MGARDRAPPTPHHLFIQQHCALARSPAQLHSTHTPHNAPRASPPLPTPRAPRARINYFLTPPRTGARDSIHAHRLPRGSWSMASAPAARLAAAQGAEPSVDCARHTRTHEGGGGARPGFRARRGTPEAAPAVRSRPCRRRARSAGALVRASRQRPTRRPSPGRAPAACARRPSIKQDSLRAPPAAASTQAIKQRTVRHASIKKGQPGTRQSNRTARHASARGEPQARAGGDVRDRGVHARVGVYRARECVQLRHLRRPLAAPACMRECTSRMRGGGRHTGNAQPHTPQRGLHDAVVGGAYSDKH